MGREAQTVATVGNNKGTVKALLETDELILRGDVRRRFPRSSITELSVIGSALRFFSGGESVSLELGEKAALSWAKAIEAPAPTLRAKLGIDQLKVFFFGSCDDEALEGALLGTTIDDPALADMIVARIQCVEDLIAAQAVRPGLAIWTVYEKGSQSPFGETAVRTFLRNANYRDTKTCSVSSRLTALRFNPVE